MSTTDRSASTFRIALKVPLQVVIDGKRLDRDAFYAWLWRQLEPRGLLGIHEGTVLSEEAGESEDGTWKLGAIDAAEAPPERDWVGSLRHARADLYFASRESAADSLALLPEGLVASGVEEQAAQDWDAQWRNSFIGISVPPFWRVNPPWVTAAPPAGEIALRINPGAGFGTGTHETTQLCLAEIGALRKIRGRVLDFGSGSGILAIGSALLGARVDAVEVDALALDNAAENAGLNGVSDAIRFVPDLSRAEGPYDLVVANILRPILLRFARELAERLSRRGTLILSGLIESDVEPVIGAYRGLVGGGDPRLIGLNEWRALVFTR